MAALYSPTGDDGDTLTPSGSRWALLASGVPCTVQALAGDVVAERGGREVRQRLKAFWPDGTPVRADVRVLVTAGPGAPARYVVVSAQPQGPGWDVESVLEVSPEVFPDPEPVS